MTLLRTIYKQPKYIEFEGKWIRTYRLEYLSRCKVDKVATSKTSDPISCKVENQFLRLLMLKSIKKIQTKPQRRWRHHHYVDEPGWNSKPYQDTPNSTIWHTIYSQLEEGENLIIIKTPDGKRHTRSYLKASPSRQSWYGHLESSDPRKVVDKITFNHHLRFLHKEVKEDPMKPMMQTPSLT